MSHIEIFFIAIALSMDAFAVSICKGLGIKVSQYKNIIIIAVFFGFFQALMPLIGWFLGKQFEQYIVQYDHWVAFGLLALIGGNMIWGAISEKGEEEVCSTLTSINYKELVILAVATSIDALAVGVTFAFLQVNILFSITTIGIITFIICLIGVVIGIQFGAKLKKKAELVGGIILILIGIKILLEHLSLI